MSESNFQTTIRTPIVFAGVAVHKGTRSRIVLRPAPADTGIVFRNGSNTDPQYVKANAGNVTDLSLGTTLSNSGGFSVGVVEHFMAACYGMGLDNVFADLSGDELPILDGSSEAFCALIDATGLEKLGVPRRILRVKKIVEVSDAGRWARLSPHNASCLRLSAGIDFESRIIGRQHIDISLQPGVFRKELAYARTFGFSEGLETLKAKGLALGGSLENAIFIKDDKIMNPEGLRVQDEFVRHKVLDAVGDLALLGGQIHGYYEAEHMGHALNNELARKLLGTPDAYEWITLPINTPKMVEHELGDFDSGLSQARL